MLLQLPPPLLHLLALKRKSNNRDLRLFLVRSTFPVCPSLTRALPEKLKAILEDNDTGQATHAKSCRSKSAVVSHSVLLAQQKLLMLKALEESSLQASILPIAQPAVVDFDDEDEHPHALQSSASSHNAASPQLIRLKFLAKTKQQVCSLHVFSCQHLRLLRSCSLTLSPSGCC